MAQTMESVVVQAGRTIDYTPGSSVAAGQVVDLGTCVGIAVRDIAANERGSLMVDGVADFLKYTSDVLSAFDVVYWDEGTNTATKTSAYGEAVIGRAVSGAASGDATVRVWLIPSVA